MRNALLDSPWHRVNHMLNVLLRYIPRSALEGISQPLLGGWGLLCEDQIVLIQDAGPHILYDVQIPTVGAKLIVTFEEEVLVPEILLAGFGQMGRVVIL